MTDKSKPWTLSSTPLLAVVLPAKRENAICIWDQPTRVEGEQKRKEERSSLTYLGFPLPPSLVPGNGTLATAAGWPRGSTKWLCREESRRWYVIHALH